MAASLQQCVVQALNVIHAFSSMPFLSTLNILIAEDFSLVFTLQAPVCFA
jgi:hypothetical protein